MRQLTLQPPTCYQMKPAKSVEGVWDEIQAYTRPVLIGEQGYLPDGRPLAVADATGLPSGSFKERGAIAKLRELQQDGVEYVVTASAGNFAAGVALGARALGMRAVVFVPDGTPSVKLANITAIGGKQVEVACAGSSFEQAYQAAQCYGNEHDLPLVEPFNDQTVALGQGTVAYELLERYGDIDHLLVPAGGGGLLAGCIEAMKRSRTKVYGVKLSAEEYLCEGANVQALGDVALRTITAHRTNWGGMLQVDPADVGAMVELEDRVRNVHAAAMGEAAYEDYPEATALLGVAAAHKYFENLPGKVAAIVTGSNADHGKLDVLHQRYLEAREPQMTARPSLQMASGYQLRGAA